MHATCSPLQCKYTVRVADLRFEWDERKNRSNRQKHGVSFEEAQTVFLDDAALLIDDPDHSDDEDRFVLLGLSSSLRTLVVTVIARAAASFGSSPPARLTVQRGLSIPNGSPNEKALRLFQCPP